MSRYNQQNRLTTKALIYRIVIAVTATLIVTLYMPRDNSSNYQFDLNKPWRYSQLIAPFDFPIYKNDDIIKREKDSILQEFEPYFAYNRNTAEEQIQLLKMSFNKDLKGTVPPHYLPYIEKKLNVIYSHGVIGMEDFNYLRNDSIRSIRVFNQNEATVHSLKDVFSIKSAYEFLTDTGADTSMYDKRTLLKCNLTEYITPNLTYDKQKSDAFRKDLLSSISYAKGMVISGQKIIDRGEIVNQDTYNILQSLEKELTKRNDSTKQQRTMLIGQLLYVTILTICLMLYFNLFRRDYLANTRSILLLASMPVIFPLITFFLIKQNLLTVYIVPFAMAPIFIRVFMDSRTAFVTHVVTVLLCAISLKYPYEFIATQLVAGMVAIYSLRELSQRSQLVRSAFYITLASLAFYLGMELIHTKDFSELDYSMYIHIIINGIFLLFAYPLLFLLEKAFGFTSNVTLVELSNINNEILRKMSEVAPGTFQHSMQVANLAAEVANRIGAKSQLVRTGALYHDIGKTCNPAFFTENQSSINPHEKLSFEDSAKIVINHVKDGIKLADKYNLPPIIKDFIATHHGKGMTKYFFISYKNKYPNETIDESVFTYPGPNPFTLEQAILMMADSVEAASRSLNEYTEESIGNLVEKIIDAQVQEGFFKDCPITFHDITLAKEVFKEKLKTIYHTRISYPELKTKQ